MILSFSSLHPASVMCFYVIQVAVLLSSTHPAVIGASFICAIVFDFALHHLEAVKSFFRLSLPLVFLCTAFNSLFSHYGVTTLFVLPGGNNYTLESIVFGLVFGAKISIMIIWLRSFNEVFTPEKLIYLFSRPFPKIALVISMALRFIPLFKRQNDEIKEAEKINFGRPDGLIRKIRQSVSNASILITWAMERGIDTSNSMLARGYGSGKRSSYSPYRFRFADGVLVFASALLPAALLVSYRSLGAVYNPVIEIAPFGVLSLIFVLVLFVVGLLPTVFSALEVRVWK